MKWKDGTEELVDLRILKEHAPVLIADYAKAFDLVDEPAFAWWAPYTLRKRDVIVSMVNARVKKRTHKYIVEVPCSLKRLSSSTGKMSIDCGEMCMRKR